MKVIKLKADDWESLEWTCHVLVHCAEWMRSPVQCDYRGVTLTANPDDTSEFIERWYLAHMEEHKA